MDLIPHNTKIDFVRWRRLFLTASLLVNAAIIGGAATFGLNWGVDFAGGSEIEIKFDRPVDSETLRTRLAKGGVPDVTLVVFGSPSENTFLLRVPRITLLSGEVAAKLEADLRAALGDQLRAGKEGFWFDPELGEKVDLTFAAAPDAEVVNSLFAAAGVVIKEIREVSTGEHGAVRQVIMSGIDAKVRSALEGHPEQAELRRIEYVGPQVGKQLRNRAVWSVFWAMVLILAYVAFRFDTRFAPGAVVAMIHDVVVVFGYYVVSRRDFNLVSVATLLTIVGYSINDTIVVYDRIRENLQKYKGRDLITTINASINETLSRTIITSAGVVCALTGLLVFTVGSVWDFAVAMLIGIFTGTYSSIYIASPVTLFFEELTRKKSTAPAGAAKAAT